MAIRLSSGIYKDSGVEIFHPGKSPMERLLAVSSSDVDLVHLVTTQMAETDALSETLARIVDFICAVVKCDSCFIYVLEGQKLVLQASMNPHSDVIGLLRLRPGQGITGWVAQNMKPVFLSKRAFADPRFEFFRDLPEDRYEAFLSVPVLCRRRLVGVISMQHREEHVHSEQEIKLISTIGFLVGADIEMARLESENQKLIQQLESRKIIERAKGILQRQLGIGEEEAYLQIQGKGRRTRRSMREVAEEIMADSEKKV
jgi:signal transduction protein with GAF and PtsI domain